MVYVTFCFSSCPSCVTEEMQERNDRAVNPWARILLCHSSHAEQHELGLDSRLCSGICDVRMREGRKRVHLCSTGGGD